MPLENEIYARPALAPEGLTHNSRPAVPPSARLERRLAALRRQQVLVAVATGAAMAMAVSVELLALAMFLDWWLDLPWFVRLVSLVLQLGTLALFWVGLSPSPSGDSLTRMRSPCQSNERGPNSAPD